MSLLLKTLLRGCHFKFLKPRYFSSEVSISLENAFKVYNLDNGPETTAKITAKQAHKYYHDMQFCRRMENAAGNLYKEKIIRGFCHLYIGQEACAVGMHAAMRDVDHCITAYRCHAWCYLMGISAYAILSELAGRKSGCSRGKGGSMHMYAPRFYGGNGIVGAQVPLGAGVALACKYRDDGGVCFALYGDGAANQGQVFEVYNMSCLWKLPVIYVCENNQYGMGTSAARAACNIEYYTRGQYIPGIWVDGMNVLAVKNATDFAIDYANKNGPIVMELYTYRYMGHSMSDPGVSYRSREEVQQMREKHDPIGMFKEVCISNELLKEDEIKDINDKIKNEIDEIVTKVKTEPEIEMKELLGDIYAKNLEPKIRMISDYSGQHIQINKPWNPEEPVKPKQSVEEK